MYPYVHDENTIVVISNNDAATLVNQSKKQLNATKMPPTDVHSCADSMTVCAHPEALVLASSLCWDPSCLFVIVNVPAKH